MKISKTYSVFKGAERISGNLCTDKNNVVIGQLSELPKLLGLKISKARRELKKNGYKLILNK